MLSGPMAIRHGRQPAQNQEAKDTHVLSPKTFSRCLLFVEALVERIERALNEVLQRN